MLRQTRRKVSEIVAEESTDGLMRLPGAGRSLARTIEEFVRMGRLPLLDRLRGEGQPEALLCTVPGIGLRLAAQIHEVTWDRKSSGPGSVRVGREVGAGAWNGSATRARGALIARRAVRAKGAGRSASIDDDVETAGWAAGL